MFELHQERGKSTARECVAGADVLPFLTFVGCLYGLLPYCPYSPNSLTNMFETRKVLSPIFFLLVLPLLKPTLQSQQFSLNTKRTTTIANNLPVHLGENSLVLPPCNSTLSCHFTLYLKIIWGRAEAGCCCLIPWLTLSLKYPEKTGLSLGVKME